MSEENKIVSENEGGNMEEKCTCFCKSEWFKKFLTKTLAVFVGTFSALSLFAALHKPPMPPCPYGHRAMMRPPMHCHYHHFKRHDFKKGIFQKRMEKRDFQRFENRDFDRKVPVKPEPPVEK